MEVLFSVASADKGVSFDPYIRSWRSCAACAYGIKPTPSVEAADSPFVVADLTGRV